MENTQVKYKSRGGWLDYLNVIKPRETALLVFIGLVTALLAAQGRLSSGRAAAITLAVLLASAGANGLTNYLDRRLDARMERTRRRALPAGRIYPAENALYFCLVLSLLGVVLAWFLSPWACAVDLVGTLAAVVYRKRVTCVFPQGMIAGCAPVMMGWLAASHELHLQALLLCVLIALWLPSHIWSIMMAHQADYRGAGLNFFPINSEFSRVARILFGFALVLTAASVGLYLVTDLGWIYLGVALVTGLMIIFASWRLMRSKDRGDAWKLYKFSSFPYLGLLFLSMAVDIWLKI